MIIGGQTIASKYLSYGLNPLPIKVLDKEPLIKKHNSIRLTEEVILKYSFGAIGISTGAISGNIEVIDFDFKNAESKEHKALIWKTFKDKVPKNLLDKLVVQRTVSGGFHLIYRCEEISSNKKLAVNKKGAAFIETRGEGGLIKCYPSKGYVMIQGSFSNIPIIKPHERLTLLGSAKMLSKTIVKLASKRVSKEALEYFKKFPKYNNDVNVGIELLKKHGWSVYSEDDFWINLTRPGKQKGVSGGYHKEAKFVYVFSTTQDNFEVERPYNNHAIYAELECKGDYRLAYHNLYRDGHGVESVEKRPKENALGSVSFLSDKIEENTYLEQARKGEIALGLSTGFREMDEYFRFKVNSLNFGLGYDGVGKSVFMLTMATSANVLHNWKWGMIMPENKTAMSRRRLVETMSGRSINSFGESPILFDKYLQESRDSFYIVSNMKHYSIKDVLVMGRRLYEEKGINALLIDPYNFFKVSSDNYYGYNNEILSELRVFAQECCAVYVMAHPSSNSPRTNIDQYGFLKPPSKYSIQGGADFPYRVDDFFVLHRITNHSDNEVRNALQFIVQKIKEVETGGKEHSKDDYTELIFEQRHGFLGYWDRNGDNPMYRKLKSKLRIKQEINSSSLTEPPSQALF